MQAACKLEAIHFTVAVSAGLASFMSPCVLPLIPAYIAHLTGVNITQTKTNHTSKIHLNAFFHSILFVIGFSGIFILLGSSILLSAQLLQDFQIWFSRIGGAVIIAFGIYTLGLLPQIGLLETEHRVRVPVKRTGRYLSSLLIGGSFGVGWTPCVGPILGSMFVLAGTSSTLGQGVTLLAAYSLGLGVPFMLAGLFSTQSSRMFIRLERALPIIRMFAGGLLVILGIVVFTNNFNNLVSMLPIGRL